MLSLILAVQLYPAVEPLVPRETFDPPSIYYTPPKPKPVIRFNRPFEAPKYEPPKEQRYIDKNGKLTTCRTYGQTVVCF